MRKLLYSLFVVVITAAALALAGCASSPGTTPEAAAALQVQRADALEFCKMAQSAAAQVTDENYKANLFRAVAEAQAKAGDVSAARQSLGLSVGPLVDSDPYFDSTAYSSIAAIQAEAGDRSGARKTLFLAASAAAKADDPYDATLAYCAIAESQGKAGDIGDARRSIRTAQAASSKIVDADNKNEVLSAIATAQADAGDVQGALATEARIIDPWKDHPLPAIATAQAETGDIRGAMLTAERTDAINTRAYIYRCILTVRVKAGDFQGVRLTLERADSRYRAEGYSILAAAQAGAGDTQGAEQTVIEIKNDLTQVRVFCSIAEIRADAGDLPAAREAIERAKSTAAGMVGGIAKGLAQRSIVEAMAEAGDVAGAKAMAAQAGVWSGQSSINIARAQAKAGDFGAAKATAAAMGSNLLGQSDAYFAIAREQAKTGDLNPLKAWIVSIQEPYGRASAALGAAEGLMQEKKK